ncbi:MAG: stage V sporulation protein AD, partial [Bacillota bacterium]
SICLAGQFVFDFFRQRQPTEVEAIALTLATMISVVVLTALGVYDDLGELGGMGAAVPITGFANTMAAAAMDFRREGLVLGMAAKMFVVAGPVIVFGIVAGILTGFAASLLQLLSGAGG